MRLAVVVKTFLLVLSLNLFGQNLISFPIGDYWQFANARSLGLAGAGSVSNVNGASLMGNPAAMSSNRKGFHVELSSTARNFEERRSFPVFNRIDDIAQQGIYAINDNWYLPLQGSVQYVFDRNSLPFLRTVAVGVFEEISHDYQYFEEIRSRNFDDERNTLAINEIDIEGKLTRYSLGLGFEATKQLHFGVQAGMLNGSDINYRQSTTFQGDEPLGTDRLSENQRQLDGMPIILSLGSVYRPTSHSSLGASFQLPCTVDYEVTNVVTSTVQSESIEYPAQATLGFEYRGQQALQARLNIDLTYEWWSSTGISTDGTESENNFDDAVVIKSGVEHIFYNQVPFQVGIQYRTAFQNRGATRTLISAGTGFMGSGWRVNVAGGFSKQNYSWPDLFDDALFGGDRSRTPIDTVEEKQFFAMLTLYLGR